MANLIQRSLAGGEINYGLLARQDVDKGRLGLKACRNFTITRTGGAQNRAGTEHGEVAPASSDNQRIHPYRVNADTAYVIVLSAGKMRVMSGNEYVTVDVTAVPDHSTGGGTYPVGFIVEGNPSGVPNGLAYWCMAEHASSATLEPTDAGQDVEHWYPLPAKSGNDFYLEMPLPYSDSEIPEIHIQSSDGRLRLLHKDHPTYEVWYDAENDLWDVGFKRWWPGVDPPTVLDWSAGYGAPGAGNTWNIRYMVTAYYPDTNQESLPAAWIGTNIQGRAANRSGSQVAGETSRVNDLNVQETNHDLSTGDPIIITGVSCAVAGEAFENAVRALEGLMFTVTVNSANDFDLDNTAGILAGAAVDGTIRNITIDWAPAYVEDTRANLPVVGGGMAAPYPEFDWLAPTGRSASDGVGIRYRIYRSFDKIRWGFLFEVSDLIYKDGKAVGTAGSTTNAGRVDHDNDIGPPQWRCPFRYGWWPATAVSHKQRLCFGGFVNGPNRVWCGSLGVDSSFIAHTPSEENDALSFVCEGSETASVLGMATTESLAIFTSDGTWIARGNEDGVITPSSVYPSQIAYDAASSTQPINVHDSSLYVERQNSIIRELRYSPSEGGAGGIAGRDLTVYAAHLFDGYTVRDMAYTRAPDSMAWVVRSDGTLLGFTYLRDQNIWAWHRHDTGGDEVLSVAVIPEAGYDALYLLTKRTVNGGTVYHLERMKPRNAGWANTDDTDWWFVDDGISDTNVTDTLTGLTHLVARQVRVQADGADLGLHTVNGSGEITLSVPGTYSNVIAGLPITAQLETLDPDAGGAPESILGRKKRVTGITIMMRDTLGLQAGVEGDLQPLPNLPEDTAGALLTDKRWYRLGGTWDRLGRVLMQQDVALPAAVQAFITHIRLDDD